jgi:protein-disulfide isomerase
LKNSGETKLFLGILIVATLLVCAAVLPGYFNKKKQAPIVPQIAPENITRQLLIPSGSHILGDPKAPYTLVEFGDFQCPACQASVAIVDKELKTHAGKLNYVFHPFRATDAHLFSPILVAALEAAEKQGKYWEMFHALFARQDIMETNDGQLIQSAITSAAKKLKLDMLSFKSYMNSPDATVYFNQEQTLGQKIMIQSTPTFYFLKPTGRPILLKNGGMTQEYLDNPANWN